MAGPGVQSLPERVNVIYPSLPDFQALPSSISSVQLMPPTKVEYYPKDNLPEIDLKGHTVEELAAIANVPVSVVEAAIHYRKQQLSLEQKNMQQQSAQITTLATTEKITTQSTTTMPSTTPYVPKKKIIKKATSIGHKVREPLMIAEDDDQLHVNFPPRRS